MCCLMNVWQSIQLIYIDTCACDRPVYPLQTIACCLKWARASRRGAYDPKPPRLPGNRRQRPAAMSATLAPGVDSDGFAARQAYTPGKKGDAIVGIGANKSSG